MQSHPLLSPTLAEQSNPNVFVHQKCSKCILCLFFFLIAFQSAPLTSREPVLCIDNFYINTGTVLDQRLYIRSMRLHPPGLRFLICNPDFHSPAGVFSAREEIQPGDCFDIVGLPPGKPFCSVTEGVLDLEPLAPRLGPQLKHLI